jgi:hypothetical protein
MSTTPLPRRVVMEWALSIGAFATVITVILTLDTRVRGYVSSTFAGEGTGAHATQVLSHLSRTALDLCRDHEPLALFVGVAFVLVLFMKQMR